MGNIESIYINNVPIITGLTYWKVRAHIMAILPASIIGFVANNKANALLYASSERAKEHNVAQVADRLDQQLLSQKWFELYL